MISNLDGRLRKLETRLRPKELPAVIQSFVDPINGEGPIVSAALPADDLQLYLEVTNDGEALISWWWSVKFFDGTKEEQEARLVELRADPRFQKLWEDAAPPVCFEGGACCDDIYLWIHKKKNNAFNQRNPQRPIKTVNESETKLVI
jgi:hypothetical protein